MIGSSECLYCKNFFERFGKNYGKNEKQEQDVTAHEIKIFPYFPPVWQYANFQ